MNIYIRTYNDSQTRNNTSVSKIINKVKFFLVSLSLIVLSSSCADIKESQKNTEIVKTLQLENDSLQKIIAAKENVSSKILTSLTFQKNDAEQAMNLYVSLFEDAEIINIHRWGKNASGKEGTIMQATFEINGKQFMVSDTPPVHNWDFTPAMAIYVECKNQDEIEKLFSKLSENGEVAMPLDSYGFSREFGWVIDRFGVSWQLICNNF